MRVLVIADAILTESVRNRTDSAHGRQRAHAGLNWFVNRGFSLRTAWVHYMKTRPTASSRNRGIANRLLGALPDDDYQRLLPDMKIVPLTLKQVLHRRGRPIRHVYFPNDGICSFTAVMRDGAMVEVATAGKEGMVGIRTFLGGNRALSEAFVQSATSTSTAVQLPTELFGRELARHGALEEIMQRYSQAFLASLMQCIACNALHTVYQRCSRWLLMAHDRMDADEFVLTQQFLAIMLGARRPTVNATATRLQRMGLIRYTRGRIQVLNRRGLESASCECYASIQQEFERLKL
jgi:CRP-like cAMP-binding protein